VAYPTLPHRRNQWGRAAVGLLVSGTCHQKDALYTGQRGRKCGRTFEIELDRFDPGLGTRERGTARGSPNLDSALDQSGYELPADVAGGADDQYSLCHSVRFLPVRSGFAGFGRPARLRV
jgi:hypothetical protein